MWLELPPDAAEAVATRHGTPFYVYDAALLRQRAEAARALPATLLYAVKANPHEALLRALHGAVDGLDVASGGELERALRCGWAPGQLSFAGPGKTPAELELAVGRDVLLSVESPRELEAVAALASRLGRRARVRLRLNPRARAQAYRVPMTGGPSPFGIDEEALPESVALLRRHQAAVDFDGLHVHPGAQCTSVGGFATAVATSLDLTEHLWRAHGLRARRLNLGGGFGVLGPGQALDVAAAGKRLASMLERYRAATGEAPEAVVEPGRWLVGPAGLYVARVVSEKVSRGTHFIVLDGGLHHHLGATGHLAPPGAPRLPLLNLSRPDAPRVRRTVVGPLCTPLDTLGPDVELPEPRLGDLLAVGLSGAYGYTLSPLLFLGHPPPAEVVLNGPDAS